MAEPRLTPPEAAQAAGEGDSDRPPRLLAHHRAAALAGHPVLRWRWCWSPPSSRCAQTKIYDATCTIIIDLTAPKVLDKDSVQDVVETGTGSYWYSREYYETQYKVLTSRAVAQRVVDKLQLGEQRSSSSAWTGEADPARQEAAQGRPRPGRPAPGRPQGRAGEGLADRPHPLREPGPAARGAGRQHRGRELHRREPLGADAPPRPTPPSGWSSSSATWRRSSTQSGKALFDFKKSHDIVATSWEDRQSMVTQRLTAINDALTKARVRKAELQARNDAIASLGERHRQGAHRPARWARSRRWPAARPSRRSSCATSRPRPSAPTCGSSTCEHHPKLEACDKKLAMARQALKEEIQSTLGGGAQGVPGGRQDRAEPPGAARPGQDATPSASTSTSATTWS